MKFDYEETIEDLATRISIHDQYGSRDIDAWMLDTIDLQPGMRIFDVGCGSGKQLLAFHRALGGQAQIEGGDVNQDLLDQARQRVNAAGADIKVIELDFNKRFPLDDNSYDLVSCCFAIYYAEDIPFTIGEMHRILKPGGKLFTTGPMPENKQTFYDVIEEATGRTIPPMPGSSRYASEILETISGKFSLTELHRFENPLRFAEAAPFIEYTRASLSEDRKLWGAFFKDKEDFNEIMEKISQVAQRRAGSDGGLVMTKVVGGIVATK
ncbi:MAG TPA: methyltransferase domain-containing protein [Anaerolineales bacterium]